MITIYGTAPSRTNRCLWLLEELGLDYKREPIHANDEGAKREAYLELNPNGKVPCLVDGNLVLFESLAINLYLMRRYGGHLAPASIEDEGSVLQWSLWATNEIDPLVSVLGAERAYKPEAGWDRNALGAAEAALRKPIEILDRIFKDRDYLLGERFSVADLNVSSVMFPGLANGMDLVPFNNVSSWVARCMSREASQRVVATAQAEFKPRT